MYAMQRLAAEFQAASAVCSRDAGSKLVCCGVTRGVHSRVALCASLNAGKAANRGGGDGNGGVGSG